MILGHQESQFMSKLKCLTPTIRRGDLDLQGDYDNALSDFDKVYYRAVQMLLITNYATLVLTCTVHVICI